MSNDLLILFVGWLLGLASSLVTSLMMFWLEGRRAARTESLKQRLEDIRTVRNWASEEKKTSLRGFDLSGANLSGKDLAGADLEDANFEGAKLHNTNLSGANLIRANFRKAKLVRVNFTKAQLLLADFTDTIIWEADFTETKMSRTKLLRVREIDKCIWKSVVIDARTELPLTLRREIEQQQQFSDVPATSEQAD